MRAKPEYRDRADTEVAVLDALVERTNGGMTVFELRSRVDVEIDDLEDALGSLKDDDLVHAEEDGSRTLITVDDSVVPEGDEAHDDDSLLDAIRRKIGL